MRFALNRDGSVSGEPIRRPITAANALFQVAAESATRAVRRCQPFRLPRRQIRRVARTSKSNSILTTCSAADVVADRIAMVRMTSAIFRHDQWLVPACGRTASIGSRCGLEELLTAGNAVVRAALARWRALATGVLRRLRLLGRPAPPRYCASISTRATSSRSRSLCRIFSPAARPTAKRRASISQIITANLKRSGLFAPIDPAAFLEKITNTDVPAALCRLARHQCAGAGHRAHYRARTTGGSRPSSGCGTCSAATQLTGQQYFSTPDNFRRIAHIISDAIYERLTGESGYFDSRIVFVDETGPKERRVKRLAMMDQDGANVRYLTRGDDLVLTPRFSPTTQEITYMSFGQGEPRVYLLNIETSQREIVGNFPGMSFSPRFAPDGQRVIMSLAAGRQRQPVRDGPALQDDDPAHRYGGDRYRPVLLAGRHPHLASSPTAAASSKST